MVCSLFAIYRFVRPEFVSQHQGGDQERPLFFWVSPQTKSALQEVLIGFQINGIFDDFVLLPNRSHFDLFTLGLERQQQQRALTWPQTSDKPVCLLEMRSRLAMCGKRMQPTNVTLNALDVIDVALLAQLQPWCFV